MHKYSRRLIPLLLALILAAGVPMMAFAAPVAPTATGAPEQSMETALRAVKDLIDIDDSVYTEFSYSSSYTNYETGEGLIWYFSWSDTKNASISATAAADGTLLNYGKYTMQGNTFGFAKIDKDSAIGIANEFIKKAKPAAYSYYEAPASVSININGGEYNLNYYATVNGYSFKTSQVSVNVNKFTGEITSYSTSNLDPVSYKFESAQSIIKDDAAIGAYVEKIGLSLQYKSYFDNDKGTITVFPVYLFNSPGDKFIGALNGDVVQYVYDRGSDGANASAPAGSAAPMASASTGGGGSALTPSEISAIERVGGFLTNDQALTKLLEAMDLKDLDVSSFSDRYIGLNRDYMNRDKYYYDINLYRQDGGIATNGDIMGVYGRVDAETGKVISFSMYYNGTAPSSGGASYTDDKAGAVADAFLKKIAPDELAKSKKDSNAQANYRGDAYNYQYVRYENGVPFRDNGISVSVNQYTGKITDYSLNWYDNVSFPSVANVLTPLQALSAFAAQNGSGVNYITTGEGNAALVFDFRSGNNWDYIDPSTGKALDYTGALWTDKTVTPDYSDVKGHWSEKFVTKLLDNGVFLWGGSFEPDRVMTELEFLNYLLLIEPQYGPIEPLAFFKQRGVNIEADPDKPLTRQEAARIIVEYLGYGNLAKQAQWFVYPFSDSIDGAYKGYVTICYMLGIVGGVDGKYDATGAVTRAQAAVMLHNLILAKSM